MGLQESIREFQVGNCVSETSGTVCSPNEDSCEGFGQFSLSGACMIDDTKFGRCGNNHCAWSPDSCSEGEEWNFPSNDCSCDQVKVGACEKDGDVFCAVSRDSCDDKSEWLSPLEVSMKSDIDCFLCNEMKAPTSQSVEYPNPSSYNVRSEPSSTSSSVTSSSSQGAQPIFYGVIGALVGMIVVVSVAAIIRLRQVKATAQENKKATVPPPTSFTIDKTSESDDKLDEVSVL